jgi:hypothetical protein
MEVKIKNDKSVDLLGLKRFQVHEILEKLAFSLKRKNERFKEGPGLPTKDQCIYEIVIKLRSYFSDNYGLSIAVDEILAEIDETYKERLEYDPDFKNYIDKREKEKKQIAKWRDLVDHWHRKGLISDHYHSIASSKLQDDKNPFDDELQRFITKKALKKRFALESSVIDEKYERMTKLFAQENRCDIFNSPDAIREKVTNETIELLEKLVTWEYYSLDGIRPMIYQVRATLDNWTLAQVIEILLGIIEEKSRSK